MRTIGEGDPEVENVAYVLGAGFSAPLGLPVTSNFLEAAQHMWLGGDAEYSYFKEIFEVVRNFASIKSYLSSNQLNIEEILSILEMQSDLRGEKHRETFVRFLCDVVKFYTPKWHPFEGGIASNWWDQMWGAGSSIHPYADFVGSLFGLSLVGTARSAGRVVSKFGNDQAQYAVLTFNYDRVLETLCENASSFLRTDPAISFLSGTETGSPPYSEKPTLIKLHGDVKEESVVPPTWSKGSTQAVLPAWRQAYRALAEATKIRFLGYSLPQGDFYFRYLLKAALAEGRYLKEVDILCLDQQGAVRRGYEEFVTFPKRRFVSENIVKYLHSIRQNNDKWLRRAPRSESEGEPAQPYQQMEEAHQRFFTDAEGISS